MHSADLPYVFGYFPKSGNIAGRFTDTDQKLADLMETFWTNFAKTGDPNGAGLPHWPRQGDSDTYLEFQQDGSVDLGSELRASQCSVYREWLTAHLEQGR